MSAVVIDFAEVIARKRAHTAAATAPAVGLRSNLVAPFGGLGTLSHDFTFWRGSTGIRYVHTVYTLIDCPELPSANITLVHRHASGRLGSSSAAVPSWVRLAEGLRQLRLGRTRR